MCNRGARNKPPNTPLSPLPSRCGSLFKRVSTSSRISRACCTYPNPLSLCEDEKGENAHMT